MNFVWNCLFCFPDPQILVIGPVFLTQSISTPGKMNRDESIHTNSHIWLVVSTPLKSISQLGWLFLIYGENEKCSKPPTSMIFWEIFLGLLDIWISQLLTEHPSCWTSYWNCWEVALSVVNRWEALILSQSFPTKHRFGFWTKRNL